MALSDIVAGGLDRPVAAIRRHAISLVVAGVAAIGAVVYAASALFLLLEAALGPIGARLAVAVVLLIVAIGGYFAPRLYRASVRHDKPLPEAEGMTRDQRLALVFEALMLGFSMGSRKPAENSDNSK
ncbi:MAG: hypothetical protein AB7V13_19930 [Pseudorhodoplanes sp.]|uniref:hypothetical protein n=1 Tax=Pseudorhodoplanes sp. TaxID=1934341 RepID=UPI003D0F34FD